MSSTTPWRHGSPTTHSPPVKKSVKHLTCYFWATFGKCKYAEDKCLYSHHHTGAIAGGPVQVEQGRPAVAGVNAQRHRAVYGNWHGTVDHPTHSDGNKSVAAQSIAQGLQQQINHIHQKATLQSNLQQSASPTTIWLNALPPPTAQLPSNDHPEHTPAIQPITPNNGHQELKSAEDRIESLGMAANNLSAALNTCQASSQTAADTLHTECEALLKIIRKLHGNRDKVEGEVNDLVNALTGSLRNVLNVVAEQSSTVKVAAQVKKTVKEELEKLGLEDALAEEGQKVMIDENGHLVRKEGMEK